MRARLISVNSHKLATRIAGQGGPAVVLESHFGGTMTAWRRVWRELAGLTTVIMYDRAGLGKSDAGPIPRTAIRIADDLRRLLRRSRIPPPYILVGHSFGGLFVQAFARRYPELVAGLVLVDSSHEDAERRMWPLTSRANRERALQFRRNNPENVDISRSLAQIRQLDPLPDVPLIVLDAPIAPGTVIGPRAQDRWTRAAAALSRKLAEELVARSRRGKLLIVRRSSHFIQLDRPEVVIAAVRQVVRTVRTEKPAASRSLARTNASRRSRG